MRGEAGGLAYRSRNCSQYLFLRVAHFGMISPCKHKEKQQLSPVVKAPWLEFVFRLQGLGFRALLVFLRPFGFEAVNVWCSEIRFVYLGPYLCHAHCILIYHE